MSKRGAGRRPLIALALLTLLAAALRLYALSRVPVNPFYDAAVRSMAQSWHNFFFGAFEPGGSASIDKPPLDLWLQVLAVKVAGFSSTALKLPGALAGTAAVPLAYACVRRVAAPLPALACAAVLALLPASVITARSDTMDSVMMLLLVGVCWALLVWAQARRLRWLVLAAVLLGLAFNVKLFEALVPLPAFLAFLALVRPRPRSRWLAAAAGALVAVSLCWLVAVSLAPSRPFAIGSSHGSVWDATFVYNGLDRITQPSRPSSFDANPLQGLVIAARAASAPAGPVRLFQRSRVDFGGLVGTLLFAALLFGALAVWPVRRRLLARTTENAAIVALGAWLLTGLVLFSFAGRVHPRYLEAFTPAVAFTLGAGLAAVCARRNVWVLIGALAACLLESAVAVGPSSLARGGLLAGVVVFLMLAGALLLARHDSRRLGRWPSWCGEGFVLCGALAALLAFPLARDVRIVREHSGVQAASPLLRPAEVAALSSYLRAHQAGARYEVAAAAPSAVSQLIVRDGHPVLLLTTLDGRPLVTLAQLQREAAAGRVGYVLVHGRCPAHPYHVLPACSAAVRWVAAHGRDVTAQLGLPGETSGLLYALPQNGQQ
jgi:4-amino-4-deoxy-L-arabinose transferase-like glycosyltransferase